MADPFALLPDSVIVEKIFYRISMEDLARSELVCKRWKMLCKMVDGVTLSDEYDEHIIWRFFCFNRKMRKVFIEAKDVAMQKSFSCWISLVSHSVQVLTIDSQMFFRSVVSCQKLVILMLYRCQIGDFSFGLPCLRTCQMIGVYINDEALARFLKLCPLLQYLQIKDWDWDSIGADRVLQIDCPNLTHLVLAFFGATNFSIVNSPNLREVKVGCYLETLKSISNVHVEHLEVADIGDTKCWMEDMIQNFTSVHSLKMSDAFLKDLKVGVNNNRMCLPHLKCICVTSFRLDYRVLSKLHTLLSYCPALEKLNIFYSMHNLGEDNPAALLGLQGVTAALLGLQGVKFTCRKSARLNLLDTHTLPGAAYIL